MDELSYQHFDISQIKLGGDGFHFRVSCFSVLLEQHEIVCNSNQRQNYIPSLSTQIWIYQEKTEEDIEIVKLK